VVVVGEWIVEPWLSLPAVAERRRRDDRLDGLGRVAGGIDPHAGFPQPEVAQDAFDDGGLVDEGDDAHLLAQGATPSGLSFGQAISATLRFVLAARAQEWVGFPDFLDEFAPLFGRNPAGLERGNVDNIALGHVHGF